MLTFDDQPGSKWAYLCQPNREKQTGKLAIFIHGFNGKYLATWGRIPELLRVHAETDPDCKSWDFLFLGYDTVNVETYLDIAAILSTELGKARKGNAPFQAEYHTFALFGHSLGTLGIRQLLCATAAHPNGGLGTLHNIVLFGTPLNGSGLASWVRFVKISRALEAGNPQLRMLRTWSKGVHAHAPWPLVQVVLGLDDKIVGSRLAELVEWPGDVTPPERTNLDHSALVKPESWNSPVINYLQNALK